MPSKTWYPLGKEPHPPDEKGATSSGVHQAAGYTRRRLSLRNNYSGDDSEGPGQRDGGSDWPGPGFQALPYGNERNSIHTPSCIRSRRDSNGRFTSASTAPATDSISSSRGRSRTRKKSPAEHEENDHISFSRSAPERDEKGRFRSASLTPARNKSKQSQERSLSSAMPRDASGRFESNRPTPLGRDKKGRFKDTPSTPASKKVKQDKVSTLPKKKSPVVHDEGQSSKVGSSIARDPPVRDHNGRFRAESDPPPVSRPESSTIPINALDQDDEDNDKANHEEIIVQVLKKLTPKSKRPPATSPYFTPTATPSKRKKKNESPDPSGFLPKTPTTSKSRTPSSTPSRPCTPGGIVSCIPFPPLSSPTFGLIQEKLANDPFRLLIAVTFLIRTHGKHAIPVFFELMEKYPTPESLVAADKDEIVDIIRHLGLQNQRAGTYQTYATIWLEDPPRKDRRYAVRGYPSSESGRNVAKGEILSDADEREAWEIGHMTQGPYCLDSWRIFCRDVLRGEAEGWNGEGTEEGFQPEWMRVVPEDKELRAFLRWMWLKEGFEWDPFTGEKEVAGKKLMRAAMESRIAWDDRGGMRILDSVDALAVAVG